MEYQNERTLPTANKQRKGTSSGRKPPKLDNGIYICPSPSITRVSACSHKSAVAMRHTSLSGSTFSGSQISRLGAVPLISIPSPVSHPLSRAKSDSRVATAVTHLDMKPVSVMKHEKENGLPKREVGPMSNTGAPLKRVISLLNDDDFEKYGSDGTLGKKRRLPSTFIAAQPNPDVSARLRRHLSQLSQDQRRVFDLVMKERKSLFFTGSAGTLYTFM